MVLPGPTRACWHGAPSRERNAMTTVPAKEVTTVDARCVRVNAKAATAAAVAPVVEHRRLSRGPDEVLIEVKAAAVNPSDVKAATGLMPYAVFPRTPGRDFAGVVIDGPDGWIGREVFGTSGDLGIRRDGTHATHLLVEAAALVEKPARLTMDEAAGIGVPFVTAIEGFRRAGVPQPREIVVIMGVTGKVGQAAAQLATWHGARVIGVARTSASYGGHASGPVEMIDAASCNVAARIRELTSGHGADIIFNTVGDPYFPAASASLALAGRQILIAAVEKFVPFNILEFYRGRHTYVGVDTLAFSSQASGELLRDAVGGFASGALRPFPIVAEAVYSLEQAKAAYEAVSRSTPHRVILRPSRVS